MAFHFCDGVSMAFILKGLPEVRYALQPRQHESRQSFETRVARQAQAVLCLKVENVDRAVQHNDGFVGELRLRGRHIEFVFDVANQLFEDVFNRDDSGG